MCGVGVCRCMCGCVCVGVCVGGWVGECVSGKFNQSCAIIKLLQHVESEKIKTFF